MGRTIAQALREEGKASGFVEGKASGFVEAKQEDLLDLLEEKFGTLPDGVYEQVRGIDDLELLNILIRRSVRADTLEDLGLGEEEVPVS